MSADLEPWVQPEWLAKYVPMLVNTGGEWNTPEHAMNCDSKSCNVVVNAPRALCCVAVQSQVLLLLTLQRKGFLR